MAGIKDEILIVNDLSKCFSIKGKYTDNFKEAIISFVSGLVKSERMEKEEDFWALRGISFTLKRGESLGIIGSNGAGKSTLLKILSNITEPSSGQILVNGKLVSILEIGTGFHPDLTGAENIFLNGELMGLTERQIKNEYFDRIVEFSGVENFIHIPVKHYSSGMYVRLAFSVAAHINADLLILDEVLTVGDAEFRIKAKSKIKSLIQSGISLLFVTHNLGEILELCNNCLWIENGTTKMIGTSADVIKLYSENNLLREQSETDTIAKWSIKTNAEETSRLIKELIAFPQLLFEHADMAPGDDVVRLLYAGVNAYGHPIGDSIFVGNDIQILIRLELLKDADEPIFIGFDVLDSCGNRLFIASSHALGKENALIHFKGIYSLSCLIKGPILNEGVFSIGFGFQGKNAKHIRFQQSEIYFKVFTDDSTPYTGLMCPPVIWTIENQASPFGVSRSVPCAHSLTC